MILFNKVGSWWCFSAFILYNFYKYNEKNAKIYYYLNYKIEELEKKNKFLNNKFEQIKFNHLVSNIRTWERSESESEDESGSESEDESEDENYLYE